MNAYELYDAVFDTARAEYIPESREDKIEDVIQVASGAFDLYVSNENATRIVDALEALEKANDENGNLTNNYWYCVEKPLSEIEL